MKQRLRSALIPTVFLPLMLLSSCIIGTTPAAVTSGEHASSSPSPTTADWSSGVKTDYTYLTPYKPPAEKYTRLKDGALPALVPSKGYGTLLPYVGETMHSNDGYSVIRKCGLVTMDGMIVTDPVYTDIRQGNFYNYAAYTGEDMPVYDLVMRSEQYDEDRPWESESHAACALDGSWVTPFAYVNVLCTDKVLLLVRDYENNNIDVMSYSGKLLYNTKALSFYGDISEASAYAFSSGYGEGLIAVPLRDGRSVIFDAMTGQVEAYVDYAQCGPFSEGYALVMADGLYGFIDRRFKLVIPPQFNWVDIFYNGKCIVGYPDSRYAIIDTDGNVLLENDDYISRWEADLYGLYDDGGNVTYYDINLKKLAEGTAMVTPIYGGWFVFPEGDGVSIIKDGEKYTINGISGVNSIEGNLAAVYDSSGSLWKEGLMTLQGDIILPPAENLGIAVVGSESTGNVFAIVSTYTKDQTFEVYNAEGKILFSGSGYATYLPEYDLFKITDVFSFAYVDSNGGDVFRLSLLKYLPD
ncbi:MAG: WG repeat-containing protein [Clostridiales bacterium]|nr:WG repeat-containing protein [Clostridiales bacterium]